MKAQLEDTILIRIDTNTMEEWTLRQLMEYYFQESNTLRARIRELEKELYKFVKCLIQRAIREDTDA